MLPRNNKKVLRQYLLSNPSAAYSCATNPITTPATSYLVDFAGDGVRVKRHSDLEPNI
jgi:hypothetical protein